MPMPESMEMYPGTSGRTHGERNETSPARNAPPKVTSAIREYPKEQIRAAARGYQTAGDNADFLFSHTF